MFKKIRNAVAALTIAAVALPITAAPIVKVDLNKASIEQLEALPRIGPAVAQRIVEYREQNGGFRKVEDLMSVRGIGEKLFAQLRDLVTVSPAPTSPAASKDGEK